jgi:acetone carboxylase gamma subunit
VVAASKSARWCHGFAERPVRTDRLSFASRVIRKLFIVQLKSTKQWKIRCECDHDFCDWRQNWKLVTKVHVRDTQETLEEIYRRLMTQTSTWQVLSNATVRNAARSTTSRRQPLGVR